MAVNHTWRRGIRIVRDASFLTESITKDTSILSNTKGNSMDKAWNTVKVGEKGQIVIPKEIREMFGIQSGDTLLVLADRERGIAIPQKRDMERIIGEIIGHEPKA